ncbi:DUF1120 domain-containing protein [Castellaniella ginsengisoli]|uniref:DUF1120 domain-containing protein n=1 Tax=Castellaniella ginsengisoli TaxID=546114 RepID=A0AB39E1I1_9BURK
MKNLKKKQTFLKRALLSSLIATAAATPMLASAASSAQLKVTGTIAPAACSITMPGGATVDYGKIAASTLNATADTKIEEKIRAKVSITCSAPTLFAIKVTDERPGTAITRNGDTYPLYGLGTQHNVKVGGYGLDLLNSQADGKSVSIMRKPAEAADWETGPKTYAIPGSLLAFGGPAVASTTANADIRVRTYVAPSRDLPLAEETPLDGLASFELVYL